jgi:exosome complex component RRP42
LDGRKFDEYRPITIETNCINNAEGSAKVKIGDSEVLAGVKCDVGKPYSDSPDEGNLMVDVQLMPHSSEHFEAGPPSFEAIEVARVTDRGIRESDMIERNKLVVESGELVWNVGIDVATINYDGNLFDLCNIAGVCSLYDAKFPKLENGVINYKEKTNDKLPLTKIPIACTVYKIGNFYIVDPSEEEENITDARLTVTSVDKKTIVALQKGGDGVLSKDDIVNMINLSVRKADEMRSLIKKQLKIK